MSLRIEQFRDFFMEVHKQEPFPWQERLAKDVCGAGGWPSQISLPTGTGKTAILDVAVFAMAFHASQGIKKGLRRRVFFVVDRRIVVDEATNRAYEIAKAICKSEDGVLAEVKSILSSLAGEKESPLIVASLRGGRLRDEMWAQSPIQPLVCCSTVDQIGSALLFRSYGSRSHRNWPIHAALVGCDSLLIVDEAHISRPFEDTVKAIQSLQARRQSEAVGVPLQVVSMSATQQKSGAAPFHLDDKDRTNETLMVRLSAPKPFHLEECLEDQLVNRLVTHAKDLGARHQAIGVVVNRVSTARRVFERLSAVDPTSVLLLIGRCRPWERDLLWKDWQARIEASGEGRNGRGESPIWVVATQCIEVGANLDFDALVTEAASLDALRQRFGRVDRLGRYRKSENFIVRAVPTNKDDEKKDPIYGEALKKTWERLKKWQAASAKADGKKNRKKDKADAVETESLGPRLDFGIDAMEGLIGSLDVGDLAELLMPSERAAVLMPGHLDVLSHTSPQPSPDIEPAALLHGREHGPADVEIVWRADLEERDKAADDLDDDDGVTSWADLVASLPPSPLERMSVPYLAAKNWLRRAKSTDATDLEGIELGRDNPTRGKPRVALMWSGKDDSRVIDATELKPGMTIIVPATYGGADRYGWKPESDKPVADLGGEIAFEAKRKAVLRLGRALTVEWESIARQLRSAVDDEEIQLELLEKLAQGVEDGAEDRVASWVRKAARALCDDDRRIFETGSRYKSRSNSGREVINLAVVSKKPVPVAAEAERESDESENDFEQESTRSSFTRRDRSLDTHQKAVGELAYRYAKALAFDDSSANTLRLAGQLHDLGKADERFQSWLRGGVAVPEGKTLLAKSNLRLSDIERARRASGWPKGGRHEMLSTRFAEQLTGERLDGIDRELLLHLIASHHGFCRPFAPLVDDRETRDLAGDFDGIGNLSVTRPAGMERLDSGVAERYWRLNRRFGWYGLAMLESVLRLADHRQSAFEERSKG